jgi:NAD(P)-dependent dehydrogenase (short-subunit alcohol dehydrogenase family)
MPVNCYPAKFRHLLSFGRRGAERVDLRDSDTLIDSRDSKKETEKESQTPVNQTSLASKFACVSRSDVSKLEDLDNLYRTVAAQKRKIELKQTPDVTPEHFDKTFNANARGLYFTVQKALPVMNDGGTIILNASCVWLKGFPSYSTYSATKAALRSFARTWTTELKDRKIRTNVISPGAIDTPIIGSQVHSKEAAEKLKAEFASGTPLGRMGRPEEIASLALFLGSDEISYVAGIDLSVDGGIAAV